MALAVVRLLLVVPLASAATVTYDGILREEFGGNLADDFVIAGTFKPGFNVSTYSYTYGDAYGNLAGNHYSHAVADGNFRPIGPGTLADGTGAFAGNGSIAGIDDLPIYLFLFEHTNPDQSFFLALATAPAWRVHNDGAIAIDGADASQMLFGSKAPGGVIQLAVAPYPEPSGAAFAAVACLITCGRRVIRGGKRGRTITPATC